ncbi:MAG: hypothetical protein ACKOK8_07210, partial [Planctomycetia bacterium]
SGATGAEPPIDPREIDLLQARASLGRGDFQAAGKAGWRPAAAEGLPQSLYSGCFCRPAKVT